MERILIILLACVVLLSCGNKRRHELPSSGIEEGWGERYEKELADSARREAERNKEERKAASYAAPQAGHRAPQHNESDNMRGFDPASENDMDDNGMSRYMENNDEEGWD